MTFFGEFANSHALIFTYPSIIVDIEDIVNPVCHGKRLMGRKRVHGRLLHYYASLLV
jgi:hypothetical protein